MGTLVGVEGADGCDVVFTDCTSTCMALAGCCSSAAVDKGKDVVGIVSCVTKAAGATTAGAAAFAAAEAVTVCSSTCMGTALAVSDAAAAGADAVAAGADADIGGAETACANVGGCTPVAVIDTVAVGVCV